MKKTRILAQCSQRSYVWASLPAINVFAANQQRTTTLDLLQWQDFRTIRKMKTRAGAGTLIL